MVVEFVCVCGKFHQNSIEIPSNIIKSTLSKILGFRDLVVCDTVDGQNPAPPRMMIIPLFIGF